MNIAASLRRVGIITLELFAALLVVAILGAGWLAWTLSQGPMPVEFARAEVERALNSQAAPLSVRVETVSLSIDPRAGVLELVADEVEASDADGVPVATLSRLDLGVAWRALIGGALKFSRIELARPELAMRIDENGHLDFGLAGSPDDTGNQAIAAFFNSFAAGDGEGPAGALEELRLSGGILTVHDLRKDIWWQAPFVDVSLRRDAIGLTGDATVHVMVDQRLAIFEADIRHEAEKSLTALAARFREIEPARLVRLFDGMDELSRLNAPVTGTVTVTLDAGLALIGTRIDMTAGAGTLAMPELWDAPRALNFAEARGHFDRKAGALTLDELFLDFGGPRFSITGTADLRAGEDGRDTAINAGITIRDTAFDRLERWWPEDISPKARAWVTKNLSDGTIGRINANARMLAPGGDIEAAQLIEARGTMEMEGVSVNYMDGLPQATEGHGTASFSKTAEETRMEVEVEGGFIRSFAGAGGGGDIEVRAGRAVLSDIGNEEREQIDIRLDTTGDLRTILAILDRPRLGFISKLGIDPVSVSGNASGDLHFRFPLKASLKLEQLRFAATASLDSVVVPRAVDGRTVTDASGTARIDMSGMRVEGQGRLDGTMSDIIWFESFEPSGVSGRTGRPVRRTFEVSARLDDTDRARMGLDTSPFVSGLVEVDGLFLQDIDGNGLIDAAINLTHADIAIPWINYAKGVLEPARIDLRMGFPVDGPARVSRFALSSAGLEAEGSIDLTPDRKGITAASLSRFSYGETDVALTLSRSEEDGLTVTLTGERLDARMFTEGPSGLFDRSAKDRGAGEDGARNRLGPVQLWFDVASLSFGGPQDVTAVRGTVRHDGAAWDQVAFDGVAGSGPVSIRYEPKPGYHTLDISAADGGGALAAMNLTRSVIGGRLGVSAATREDTPETILFGGMELTGFEVVDAPAIARLFNALSFQGLGELLAGDSIGFDRLSATIVVEDGTLQVTDGRLQGSGIGMTGEGYVALDGRDMDLRGSVVPLYGLNRVLSAVPVIGDILAGEEGGGLFAASYQLQGPPRDPQVTVNPLSVLAPGFLRNLMQGDSQRPDPVAENPPAPAQPQSPLPSPPGNGPETAPDTTPENEPTVAIP